MPDRIITIGGLDVLDPGELRANADRLRLPLDFWGRANAISNPLGSEPGVAWVAVPRATWNALDNNAAHSITWTSEFDSITTAGWTITRAMCLAQDGDSLAAYLIELKDPRHLLRLSSVNSQYNVRNPSPHKTESDASGSGDWSGYYYSGSLDGGTDKWTWQTLLDDLWSNLPASIAGTAPTLPYSPADTPENWRFIGRSAWSSIDEVLSAINCRIAWHPTSGVFSYVRIGQTQTGLALAQAALTSRLLYDYKPGQNLDRAECPEKIRVFFQRRPEYAGSERDSTEGDNWEIDPAHSVDVATGVAGAVAGTVLPVWDSLIAAVQMDDTVINSGDLATRAAEVAAEIVNRITVGDERARKHYAGITTTILPGSETSEVVWRDYGDGDGLITEVRNLPRASAEAYCREHLSPPDLARASHLIWPHRVQIVQAYDSGESAGATLAANGDGVIPGRLVRWNDGTWEVIADVWLKTAEAPGTGSLLNEEYFHGRLAGSVDGDSGGSGDVRPLYIVKPPPTTWVRFKNDSGGVIPAYAMMYTYLIVDDSGTPVYVAYQQPGTAAGYPSVAAINAGVDVDDQDYGLCSFDGPAWCLYDTADGSPAIGQNWGPMGGSFKIRKYDAANRRCYGFYTHEPIETTPDRVLITRGRGPWWFSNNASYFQGPNYSVEFHDSDFTLEAPTASSDPTNAVTGERLLRFRRSQFVAQCTEQHITTANQVITFPGAGAERYQGALSSNANTVKNSTRKTDCIVTVHGYAYSEASGGSGTTRGMQLTLYLRHNGTACVNLTEGGQITFHLPRLWTGTQYESPWVPFSFTADMVLQVNDYFDLLANVGTADPVATAGDSNCAVKATICVQGVPGSAVESKHPAGYAW